MTGHSPQAFQVDLRGVVDLLARHLYSGPRVYLRELLQNGVDAVGMSITKQSDANALQVADELRRQIETLKTQLPADVEIRVHDTTAETRFLVLPLRPEGTDGWSEDELAAIVTREAMIGVANVTLQPQRSPG